MYAQRVLREDIVDKALKRDLPSIYGIRNISDIEKIFLYLCYTSSNIINLNALTKELEGVSRNTIEKYIGYLESANLIYISPLVNVSGKQILKSQDKIYIADAAMRNAVLMKDDITNDPTELGIIAETAVYKHIKAFYFKDAATVGYFRGDKKDKEIDIVVKSERFRPIQIYVNKNAYFGNICQLNLLTLLIFLKRVVLLLFLQKKRYLIQMKAQIAFVGILLI